MPTDKKISELNSASAFTGVEKFEILQGGLNLAATPEQMKTYIGGVTREFDRAFSTELLFDKNEIAYEEHILTGDLAYTVAASGHLANQFSSATQIVETDGTRTVTFTGFNFVLGDIQSGSMPDAGTYLVLFLYFNGVAIVNWTEPSLEVANLTPLTAPANFAAVPGTDPETEVDLSWSAVPNVSSYEIQYSVSGGAGPWIALTTPASGATTYTHTGLTANTTYHYRIRAIGDGIAFSNSAYSIAATTTQDPGDVTAPTFVFSPANAETDIPMNGVATITASEPLQDADGVTAITNANITDYLVVKETNIAGADIPYTATIDDSKTIITITPNVIWPSLGVVFIQISGVEDINNNEAITTSITFTANDYTLMVANYLSLGQQFNAIVTGNDIDFELEYTFKDAIFSGTRGLFQKEQVSNNKSFLWATEDDNVYFLFYQQAGTSNRKLVWTGALTGITSGKIRLEYYGTIDTNNGLDRADLYIDDVLVGSKTLVASGGAAWPFGIATGNATLYISGPTTREVKNAFIRNNSGATVQGQYPVIRTGLDTSGNARHGTWV